MRWITALAALVVLPIAAAIAVSPEPTAKSPADDPTFQNKAPPSSSMGGEQIFDQYCAKCHLGQVAKAPHRMFLQMMAPDAIQAAMDTGIMRAQAIGLTESQKAQVATWLGGEHAAPPLPAPTCSGQAAYFDTRQAPAASGWGITPENTRHIAGATAGLEEAVFDPVFTINPVGGRYNRQLATQVQSLSTTTNVLKTGFLIPGSSLNQVYLEKLYRTGGKVQIGVGQNLQQFSPAGTFVLVNPAWQSSVNLIAEQPLLRGRGPDWNEAPLRIALRRGVPSGSHLPADRAPFSAQHHHGVLRHLPDPRRPTRPLYAAVRRGRLTTGAGSRGCTSISRRT